LIISSDVKELKPLAHSVFFLSKIFIWSPLLNFPVIFLIPAANKLFPDLKAFFAPSSIMIEPFGATELIIHFFLASSFETLELNQVQ